MKLEYVFGEWKPVYDRLLAGIPRGNYYDHRSLVVPVSASASFHLTTSAPGKVHYVKVKRENEVDGAPTSFTVIPQCANQWLDIPLGRGLNAISVVQAEDNYATTSVVATYYAAVLAGYAEELYRTYSKLEKVNRDVRSDESTRLLSPIISFSEDLANVHELRTFGLQVIIRALVNFPGMMRGFENVCKGLYVSTPSIIDAEQSPVSFNNLYSGQEYELGKLVRLWTRNPGEVRRQYLAWLKTNAGEDIGYVDGSTISSDGSSTMPDEDSPLMPGDVGVDEETGEREGSDEESVIEIELPRTDRNFPIPFTKTHPWTDKQYTARRHLDSGTSLDIATKDDPLEHGMLGEKFIPLRKDGSKASAITKVMTMNFVPSTSVMALNISSIAGVGISTEKREPIARESLGQATDVLIRESSMSENVSELASEQEKPISTEPEQDGHGILSNESGDIIIKDDRF